MHVTAIVLAAGSATRMGADKLRLPWRGAPVLTRAVAPLIASPAIADVLVVVQPGREPPRLPDGVRLVPNAHHDSGMASSLVAGVRAADPSTDAYLLALGDMPGVDDGLIARLIDGFSESDRPILVPVFGGRRGHPVLFDRSCRALLLDLSGDVGARGVLAAHPERIHELPVDDPAVLFDVDTPADLSRSVDGRAAALSPPPRRGRVLIKGAGEQASGSAHRLFRSGFRVVMTEVAEPAAVRRAVSFSTAVQEVATCVEGVGARRWDLADAGRLEDFDWTHVPVFVDPDCSLSTAWRPDVSIDGRILKHNRDNRPDDAALVIGLGPGLEAGKDVHLVVETSRGHDLGRVIEDGAAAPNTGIPGSIGGFSAERVLRAPAAGVLSTDRSIGDVVEVGDPIGLVAGVSVRAAIPGVIRGLLRDGQSVALGQKIGDIDPRGDVGFCWTLSDKTRTISGAVLEAVVRFYASRA
jgi:xanthine dehydrogenase accessory factor